MLGHNEKASGSALASPFGRGGCERSEQTERARTLPGRADFPSFRLKSHVLERKSQTFKQSAQKDGAKFGRDAFDRSRKNIFEKQ